jgi:hypothetical protein
MLRKANSNASAAIIDDINILIGPQSGFSTSTFVSVFISCHNIRTVIILSASFVGITLLGEDVALWQLECFGNLDFLPRFQLFLRIGFGSCLVYQRLLEVGVHSWNSTHHFADILWIIWYNQTRCLKDNKYSKRAQMQWRRSETHKEMI